MSKNPYMHLLDDPDDVEAKYCDFDLHSKFVKERMDLLCKILEPEATHELTRSVFFKDDYAGCHMAKFGCESMYIGKGEIEVTVRGKRTRVTEGDVMHFGVFNSHEMHWLEDTPWIGFFHHMNICAPTRNKAWVADHNPDLTDEDMAQVFHDTYDCISLEEPVAVDVPKSEIYEIRDKDFAFAKFEFDGVVAEQKIGRWETNGMYEYWRLTMEDGFFVESNKINPRGNIYFVVDGNVRFRIYDDEFVAPANSTVYVPEYSKHSFCAEGPAVMYDMYNSCLFFDLISDVNAMKEFNPDKLKDPKVIEGLKEKYACYVTNWGKKK